MPTEMEWQDENQDDESMIVKTSPHSQFIPLELLKRPINKPSKTARAAGEHSELLSVKRLVVLVPNQEVDEAQLSRQIWKLAAKYRLDILLISIVNNTDESISVSRRLTTITAITADPQIKLEKQVVFASSWDKALRPFWQQMDMILCPQELKEINFFGKETSLSQILSDKLKVPVYTFSGLYHPNPQKNFPFWLYKVPFGLGLLLIILISFYFETNIGLVARGWLGQIFFGLAIIIEIALIYIWTLIAG